MPQHVGSTQLKFASIQDHPCRLLSCGTSGVFGAASPLLSSKDASTRGAPVWGYVRGPARRVKSVSAWTAMLTGHAGFSTSHPVGRAHRPIHAAADSISV